MDCSFKGFRLAAGSMTHRNHFTNYPFNVAPDDDEMSRISLCCLTVHTVKSLHLSLPQRHGRP